MSQKSKMKLTSQEKKQSDILDSESLNDKLVELKTTNSKVLNFYMEHKTLDFELMNIMFIDILDELLKGMSGDMTKTMTDRINNLILEQSNDILTIKEHIKTLLQDKKSDMQMIKDLNNDIINNIVIKLFDIKKDYINDMKLLIDKHESDNIIKIIDRLDKESQKLINEIIPKTNTHYYNQYESIIKSFKYEISNMNNSEKIENKYIELLNNIEKSMITYITTTENRLHNDISDIKKMSIETNTNQSNVNEELMSFLNKTKNSSFKGQIAENQIEDILNKLYPYADIKRTSDEDNSGDFIMTRTDGLPILFEIKDYNRNIPTDEVNKFIRDVTDNDMCGIFISISTGISKKRNYEIEISENNNIMLYIHNMNYDSDKIKLGVDIIDNLYSRLKLNNKNDVKISTELLNQINKEYNIFITKRTQTIEHIKETTKKTIQYIEEMEMKSLNELLSSKFSFKNNNKLRCDTCKNFVGTNAKSLAAHLRKCKIKIIKSDDDNDDEIDKLLNSTDNNSPKIKSPKEIII